MDRRKNVKSFLRSSQKLWILIAVMIVLTVMQPGVFLTVGNFKSILLSISLYGIMVCGTIFTILIGGIDLSVGAVAASSSALTVKYIVDHSYSNASVAIGVLIGLGFGILIGLIHGFLVAQFGVPAFLVTLASQNAIYGLAQVITNNKVITCMEPEAFAFIGGGRLFGIPFSIYILAVIFAVTYFILNRTVFGRKVYAVGGNAAACNLSGVKSNRIILMAYAASGLTAAISGIVLASMNRQAIPKAAQGYENDVLTAIVVGGASLLGGEGKIQGAIWGALLVGMIGNGLRLIGIPSTYHGIVKGIVIILAVALDAHVRYNNSGLKKNGSFRKKAKA